MLFFVQAMMTKPRGIWATFQTECSRCQGDITVSNGRPEHHVCRERELISLADIRAALGRSHNA